MALDAKILTNFDLSQNYGWHLLDVVSVAIKCVGKFTTVDNLYVLSKVKIMIRKRFILSVIHLHQF